MIGERVREPRQAPDQHRWIVAGVIADDAPGEIAEQPASDQKYAAPR